MLHNIIPASIQIVPEPHMGSTRVEFLSQPEREINPAAITSLRGAMFVSMRYPRLNNASPDVSSSNEHVSPLINRLNFTSGCLGSTLGRALNFARNLSTMASLVFN